MSFTWLLKLLRKKQLKWVVSSDRNAHLLRRSLAFPDPFMGLLVCSVHQPLVCSHFLRSWLLSLADLRGKRDAWWQMNKNDLMSGCTLPCGEKKRRGWLIIWSATNKRTLPWRAKRLGTSTREDWCGLRALGFNFMKTFVIEYSIQETRPTLLITA